MCLLWNKSRFLRLSSWRVKSSTASFVLKRCSERGFYKNQQEFLKKDLKEEIENC